MSDDITHRLRAAVPKMPDSGTPIAWPCKVRSELLLEAAAEIKRLREALTDIANQETTGPYKWQLVVARLCEIAREALEGRP